MNGNTEERTKTGALMLSRQIFTGSTLQKNKDVPNLLFGLALIFCVFNV